MAQGEPQTGYLYVEMKSPSALETPGWVGRTLSGFPQLGVGNAVCSSVQNKCDHVSVCHDVKKVEKSWKSSLRSLLGYR